VLVVIHEVPLPRGSARRVPKKNGRKSLAVKDINRGMTLAVCPYSGVDLNWAQQVSQRWSPRKSVRHLTEAQSGMRPAKSWALITIASVMFKITQNTLRDFTLAEVLLMAAMNQLEAKRKAVGNEGCQLNRCPYRPEAA